MKNRWRSWDVKAALIILLTVVVYLPTLHAGFVFDDHELIRENRMVRASDGLYRFWFTAEPRDYRPVTWSLWWLEWQLWDGDATGYHVVNVLLHAVNAVLVWLILRRLKIPGAWLAAMVFAIHPVNVATAAWICEQKNTLSMLFFALSILLYLRFDDAVVGPRCCAAVDAEHRVPTNDDRTRSTASLPTTADGERRVPTIPMYVLSLLAFLLALLSKTAVVMLPVVLLGCAWWRRGRVRWQDWLYSVPYFVGSAIMALVTIVQHQRALDGPVQSGGFAARLAGAGWAPWFYLSKALLPVNLTVIYPKWNIDPFQWMSYVPGTILIAGLVTFWCKRKTWGRPLLFGLGYFVVMFFPVLGFFDQSFYRLSLVADHWQYYSIIGVIALVVAGGANIGRWLGQRKQSIAVVICAGLIMMMGIASWRRGFVYANDETLWSDNVAKNPNAWLAQNNLGTALTQAGKPQEAIGHYEEALRIKPDYAGAHYSLGDALAQLGRLPEAMEHWEQALRLKPDFAEAHNNLGTALLRLGKVQQAIEHYQQALHIKPDDADTHYNLGVALEQTGRIQDAIEHYEQALRLNPGYIAAQNRLGRLRSVR